MNFKYGKFLALGLVLLAIAGCSKQASVPTQGELEQNKKMQQDMNNSGAKR